MLFQPPEETPDQAPQEPETQNSQTPGWWRSTFTPRRLAVAGSIVGGIVLLAAII
jgi:hypothetical protein